MTANTAKTILLAPAPRKVAEIFSESDLARLKALGNLNVHDSSPFPDDLFNEIAGDLQIILGQIDLPESRLKKATGLRAIFNVEGNWLPNIAYDYCFKHGIRVLSTSPVFAEPVAEAALGMAVDLARGITRSDRNFRRGTEEYGLAANRDTFSLFRETIGFIGFGDLARSILPLLRPFDGSILAYDPWLSDEYLAMFGCKAASLDEVLRRSRLIFVVAGVTTSNQGFLGAQQFSLMQHGAALVLISRAAVVDFDAMLDFAARGVIRVATDVFPQEPLLADHPARKNENILLCAHQAGALETAIKRIGTIAVSDAELVARGLPPLLCKAAQPETVLSFRSQPISRT